MQLLIFFSSFRQKGAVLVKRQLKYYTINQKESQAFFENFFNFFYTFLIFFQIADFYTYFYKTIFSIIYSIIYNMSRVNKNVNDGLETPPFAPFYLQPLQVLQFPEHFLLCLPVAESISPE